MIGLWNLNALANAFLSLLPSEPLVEQLGSYQAQFEQTYRERMRAKLGLPLENPVEEVDSLVARLLTLLAESSADYTRSLRFLALIDSGDSNVFAAEIGAN